MTALKDWLVKGLHHATVFQYDVVTQKDMSDSISPLQPFARLERRTVKFKAGTSGSEISDAIVQMLPLAAAKGMFRVSGEDDEGDFHRLDYDSAPPDEFAKEEVDALADEVVLTFGDITQSTYVETMLEVLDGNPALLGSEGEE